MGEGEEPPAVLPFTNRMDTPVRLLLEIIATEVEVPPHSTVEIHFSRHGDAELLVFADDVVVVWSLPDRVTVLDGPRKGERLEDWGEQGINRAPPELITHFAFENDTGRSFTFVARPDGPALPLPQGHTMEVETAFSAGDAIQGVIWDGHQIAVIARPRSIARTNRVKQDPFITVTRGELVWPPQGKGLPSTAPFRYAFSGLRMVLDPGAGWEEFLLFRGLRATLAHVVPGGGPGAWWVVARTDQSIHPENLGTPYERAHTHVWLRGDWPVAGRDAFERELAVDVFMPIGQLRGRMTANDLHVQRVGDATARVERPEDPPAELVDRPEVLKRRWWQRRE